MRLVATTIIGLCLAFASQSDAQQVRPSFNCARATFPDEYAICADERLAQMDQAASIALGQVGKGMIKDARDSAYAQLKERHACGANTLCILNNQAEVIGMMKDYGASISMPPWLGSYRLELVEHGHAPFVEGLPKQVGQCTRTKISGITTRFGDELKRPDSNDDSSGTAVQFADQGYGVSYSYEEAIGDSAIGDDVVLCLTSIPKGCPPGDERGKMYMGVNLRTKGSWQLPDAQHMCGGA